MSTNSKCWINGWFSHKIDIHVEAFRWIKFHFILVAPSNKTEYLTVAMSFYVHVHSTIDMSSTYLKVEILLPSGLTSLIIAKNIIGPNFVPCGTPACKVDQSEHVDQFLHVHRGAVWAVSAVIVHVLQALCELCFDQC